MAISRIFNISTRSLSAYQKAMDVTAHNIANAGNPDYSRQKVYFESSTPQAGTRFYWGSGIKIADLRRVHDSLVDSQIIRNNQKFAAYKKQSEILGQIETVFGEPSEYGLSNYLSKFFDSWTALSSSPSSVEARKEVVYSAQNLSSKISDIYQQLNLIESDIVSGFREKTTQVNTLLHQVGDLNKKIFEAKAMNTEANDLMDKRDKLIKELSNLVDLKVNYDKNGIATLYVGGIFAVNADSVTEFKMDKSDGKLTLRTVKGSVRAALSAGEISALADAYTDKITNYKEKLNKIFTTLVKEVNAVHEKGYTIDNPPQTGIKFFSFFENGNLQINEQVLRDPMKIAVSSDGSAGNGDLAIVLGDLKNKKAIDGLSIGEYYSEMINDLGNTVNKAKSSKEAIDLVLQQLKSQRDSYSAVSIDEEMTNILKYQKSYDASAKLVKMANEMLDTLINMV